jgi:hypothetical protein
MIRTIFLALFLLTLSTPVAFAAAEEAAPAADVKTEEKAAEAPAKEEAKEAPKEEKKEEAKEPAPCSSREGRASARGQSAPGSCGKSFRRHQGNRRKSQAGRAEAFLHALQQL